MFIMNKVSEIIDALLKHEITKEDAIEKIKKLTDKAKPKNAIECDVMEVAYSVEHNHGRVRLEIPYGYHKIEGKLKKGDKAGLIILP